MTNTEIDSGELLNRPCCKSLVVPIYRNEKNIDSLISALNQINEDVGGEMEVIFVIDGSPDKSGELLISERHHFSFASTIAFHSRNFGSFTAIRTGMELSSGEAIAVMAADLQEPPSLIKQFFAILSQDEADIVFGQRIERDDSMLSDLTSNIFWWIYRKLVIRDVPKGGVDIFACNRMAANTVLEFAEPNSSLVAQLFWIGFRRSFVPYQRRPRLHGSSGWNFSRRLRYMMDSIFSFSDLPILLVLWFGVIGCLLSLGFAVVVAIGRISGIITQPGYAALVLLILFTFSSLLAVQGVIGSYLWRTFENTKRRPLRIIHRIVK